MSKIMLVDDDQTMRNVLKTLLEIEGHEVIPIGEKADKQDLFESLRKENPDVILMDVHLRGMNGLDILKEIRGSKELPQPYIIMASGKDMKNQCQDAGANYFLMKPYMPDELLSRLKTKI